MSERDKSPASSPENRQELYRRSIRLLAETAVNLLSTGDIDDFRLHASHDVHGFYESSHRNETVHVQAYPGMSRGGEAVVNVRGMDPDRLREIQALGTVSVGNEHNAVSREMNPQNLPFTFLQEWDSESLAAIISDRSDKE